MGPTWVLSAPDGPHVGPMNLAIREILYVQSEAGTAMPRGATRYPKHGMGQIYIIVL